MYITNAIEDLSLPVYGNGLQVRDHLLVNDHCSAIDLVLHGGVLGEVYNIGAHNEVTNRDITERLLALTGRDESFIEWVPDRLGHDRRYSVDTRRIRALGWAPVHDLADGLAATVAWYRDNASWWEPLLGDRP